MTKDEFLEAVNKPGDEDLNLEIIETTTEVFEENEQSETTTNIRLLEINRLTLLGCFNVILLKPFNFPKPRFSIKQPLPEPNSEQIKFSHCTVHE